MLDAIEGIVYNLKKASHPAGIHRKLKNVPKAYIKKYSLRSPYHFEMPASHRLMYAVRKGPAGKEALLLQLLTREQHNKTFGYFKKKSH